MLKNYVFLPIFLLFSFNCFATQYGYKECPNSKQFKRGSSGTCYGCENGRWDRFVYCQDQEEGCAGVTVHAKSAHYWLYTGDMIQIETNLGDEVFVCCEDGELKKSSNGYPNWIDEDNCAEILKDLGNHQACKQKKCLNFCGGTEITDCFEPNDCLDGYTFRNHECVLDCAEGYAFRSETSNECVACESGVHQGIVYDEYYMKVCARCGQSKFFVEYNSGCGARTKDKKTLEKCCVDSKDFKSLSHQLMKKCFMSGEMFLECMKCLSDNDSNDEECASLLNKYKIN